jgi:hypothetical protein
VATLRCELVCRFTLVGEIRGDEHTEVTLGRNEDALYISIFDLYAAAVADVCDELAPGRPEIDEDHEDWQRAVAGGSDSQRIADLTVHAVGADEIVGPDRFRLPRVSPADDGGDASRVGLERRQFRPIPNLVAAATRCGQQDRLGPALWAVLHGRFGAQRVQAGEDGVEVDRRFFCRAVERRLGHHDWLVLADRMDLVAQTKATEDLQAAEAEIAGFRIDEHLAPLFHQQ